VCVTHGPGELGADGSHLEYAAGERLGVGERRRVIELVGTDQLARDSRRLAGASRGHDDSHARVTQATHGAAARVHHETHQEPADQRYDTIRDAILTCARKPTVSLIYGTEPTTKKV